MEATPPPVLPVKDKAPTHISAPAAKECVRWGWTGDAYNRTVWCITWRDKK